MRFRGEKLFSWKERHCGELDKTSNWEYDALDSFPGTVTDQLVNNIGI